MERLREFFKRFKILIATRSNLPSKSGWSITLTDLVAYRTELVVMPWDVVHSLRIFQIWRVATIFKVTSRELLRHLASLL